MSVLDIIVMFLLAGIGAYFGARTATRMGEKYQAWAGSHFGAALLIAYCVIFLIAVGVTLSVVFLLKNLR